MIYSIAGYGPPYVIGAAPLAATAAATIAAESPALNKAAYSVPADSLILHPCVTKDMLRGRVADPSGLSFSMMMFDRLGCWIDPLTGWRIPEDCGPRGAERRSLCPGGPLEVRNDVLDRLVGFLGSLASMIPSLISAVGPGLSELLAPPIAELGQTAGVMFGGELRALVLWIDQRVSSLFAGAAELRDAATKTFRNLGGSAKTVADALGSAPADLLRKAAVPGVRNSLGIASQLLEGNTATIAAVEAHAHDSIMSITTYASATAAKDAQKSLVVLQETARYAAESRGVMDAASFGHFASTIPDLSLADTAGQVRAAAQNVPRDAGLIADEVSARFRGAHDRMISDLDGAALAAMLPASKRLDFMRKFDAAKAFGEILAPHLRAADQLVTRTLDQANHMLVDPAAFPNLASMQLEAYQAEVRRVIEVGMRAADRIVEEGATEARLRGSSRAPSPARSYDYTEWFTPNTARPQQMGAARIESTRAPWPLERGV